MFGILLGVTLISDFKWYYDTLSNTNKADETISILAMKTVEYTFDGAGNRLSISYPSGRLIECVPDALNRVGQIQEGATVLADYDYVGRRTAQRVYPNGMKQVVSYSAVKDAVVWGNQDASDIDRASFDYAYTRTHHKKYELGTDDYSPTPISEASVYRHDGLLEVTGTKYGVPGADIDPAKGYDDYLAWEKEEQFVYDGVGNRKTSSKQDFGQPLSTSYYNYISGVYTPDAANRYNRIETPPDPVVNRVHDANGSVTDDGEFTFEYNYKNELMRATRKSDLQVVGEYNYNCLGLRVMKFASPMKAYILDMAQVIEEYDLGTGDYNASYVYGNRINEVLQMDRPAIPGSPFYYSTNQLGSVALITDHTGANVEAYSYSTFGETQCYAWDPMHGWMPVMGSQIDNDHTWQGLTFDAATGDWCAGLRVGSPEEGRYIQRVPILWDEFGNPYSIWRHAVLDSCDSLSLSASWIPPTIDYEVVPRNFAIESMIGPRPPFLRLSGLGRGPWQQAGNPLVRNRVRTGSFELLSSMTPQFFIWIDNTAWMVKVLIAADILVDMNNDSFEVREAAIKRAIDWGNNWVVYQLLRGVAATAAGKPLLLSDGEEETVEPEVAHCAQQALKGILKYWADRKKGFADQIAEDEYELVRSLVEARQTQLKDEIEYCKKRREAIQQEQPDLHRVFSLEELGGE